MASQDNNIGGSTSGSENLSQSTEPPLWKYVTKQAKQGLVGGTWNFRCNFCNDLRNGSYSRVRAHLLGIPNKGIAACKKVNASDKAQMTDLDNEYENKKLESGDKEVPLPCETSKKRRMSCMSPFTRAFGVEIRDQLDQEIVRMFYTGGVPFNLARNPHYHRSYQFAAMHKIDGYVPPGYNKLRTTLLQQEKNHVEKKLEPIKGTWKEKGVTIVTDGWSDPTRKPLINFMATSGSGTLFLDAVNYFGEVKDKFFIANLMEKAINQVGHQNVVQIITDNAANCKAAGEHIESLFPHIFWTPCVVHTLNLALKNICAAKNTSGNQETYDECSWITIVHADAMAIKNFIMNHNMRLAMFNKFCALKLLSIAETHFASTIVMLKRLKLIRRGLQAMVISEDWSTYKEDDLGKARFVKDTILNDEWWDKVCYIIDFTRPIYEMIRVCDTDKPCLHLVYEMWDSMIETVKFEVYKQEKRTMSEDSSFYDVIYKILVARWAKNNTPLHCIAHSLNPRFYSDQWLNENSERIGPHKDVEISRERMKGFRRLFLNDDDYRRVLDEYASFSMKMGPFEDLSCLEMMSTMEPKNWWLNYGTPAPLLQTLAFKLLGPPSSSSCCERNWSTYSFIHSLKRNRLNPSRAKDLVFIHNNLRLLSRSSPQYEDEKTKKWDVGGDGFDSMEDVGYLEFAELSLDDPELEEELINNN